MRGRMGGALLAAMCLLPWIRSVSTAQGAPTVYQHPDAPLDARVRDLLGRLTLEEKVSQLLYTSAAIPRLGIPEYNWWNEALHGVARAGRATVFPQAIGLAATWDTALLHRVATTIAEEARAKHHEAARQGRRGIYEGLTFWSPNINIFRDPLWGRGMETYGEDPVLAGGLAVAFVRGMQGDDPRYLTTVATPKHFAVHSGPEPERHSFDAVASARDFRETYLPHFETAMVEGGAGSIMCAYNRVYGDPACASPLLLEQILRREWGFTGYVVSDCWAISDIHNGHKVQPDEVHAAAVSLAAGTDLSCGPEYASLTRAVGQGLVTEAQVDTALARLLRARFRLGMFDPPERLPFAAARADAPPAVTVIDGLAHRALALDAARKSLVLLKNAGGVLPLRRDLGTIAVIGPNADDVDLLLGNYNGLPTDPVTPLQGIRRAVAPGTRVLYARGADLAPGMPTFTVVPQEALRLRGEYFADHEFEGQPPLRRDDATVDFTWWDTVPAPGLPSDSFSVRWTGTLTAPVSGSYALGVRAQGGVRLFLDDSVFVEFSDRHVVLTQWASVPLTGGSPRRLRLEYLDRRADALVQLVWAVPNPRLRDEALDAARQADAVVMMLGLSPRLEGEEMPVDVPGFRGGDRLDLDLPAPQQELLEAVTAVGTPVALVLLNGSALSVTWAADHVPAILEAWYPGQAAGTAIADVLPVGGAAAAIRRLRDAGADVPVLHGRAPVPVRPRAQLHDVRLSRPARAGHGAAGRHRARDGRGPEHRVPGGRGGRAALRWRPRGVRAGAGAYAGRIPAHRAGRRGTTDGRVRHRAAPPVGHQCRGRAHDRAGHIHGERGGQAAGVHRPRRRAHHGSVDSHLHRYRSRHAAPALVSSNA